MIDLQSRFHSVEQSFLIVYYKIQRSVIMSLKSKKILFNIIMFVLTAGLIFSTFFVYDRKFISLTRSSIWFFFISSISAFIHFTPESDSLITEKQIKYLKIHISLPIENNHFANS